MQVAWDPDLNARHPRKIIVALSARGYDLSFAHNEMGTLGESEHSDGLTFQAHRLGAAREMVPHLGGSNARLQVRCSPELASANIYFEYQHGIVMTYAAVAK